MSFNFNNETPIYLQIIEHLKKLIISRQLLPNQRIMPVREMSLEYGVNPNTVQKALKELEDMGLIYTESTNGKYVTTNKELISNMVEQTINEEIEKFYKYMAKLGLSKDEVNKIIEKKVYFTWFYNYFIMGLFLYSDSIKLLLFKINE